MGDRPDVRICRQADERGVEWLVWLDDRVAGRFMMLGEALDFALILECSPRARAAAHAGLAG